MTNRRAKIDQLIERNFRAPPDLTNGHLLQALVYAVLDVADRLPSAVDLDDADSDLLALHADLRQLQERLESLRQDHNGLVLSVGTAADALDTRIANLFRRVERIERILGSMPG